MTLNDFAALAKILADLIVYVWLFSLAIALLLGRSLNQLGFTFRTLPGFWSPPVSESINQTVKQPLENAELYLFLGGLLLLRGTRDLIVVTLIALLVDCLSGAFLTRNGKPASSKSILFTYLGFLLLRGYFEPGIIAILMTILVGCICGRMLWGMAPQAGDAAWKSHLISFAGGILTARLIDAIAKLLPVSQLW
ncbi:MAG: hypothetical protein HC866_09620 [Leptolyngbyaceae cyanobacterium RU_5_1]|nr:hypothetical protein [Leptolyngbyaceae cyanobacterium RU_5_1]